jgi:hypothetical protein
MPYLKKYHQKFVYGSSVVICIMAFESAYLFEEMMSEWSQRVGVE